MKTLNTKNIVTLHDMLIEKIGGVKGVLNFGSLDAAVHAPFQSFGGVDLYPTIQEKASRLCYSLISNHPLVDGNKRGGVLAMLTFLKVNGIELNCTNNDLIKLGLSIVEGKSKYEDVTTWVNKHCKENCK